MKTIRIFTFASLLAAVSLTSCLKDNDTSDSGLTPAEIEYCATVVKGNYSGLLIYSAKNIKDVTDVTDTVAVSWTITNDSTLTIHKFPSRLLAEQISDENLKSAIAEAPDQDINCRIGFITNNPIQWLINPAALCYKVQFEGAEHVVYVRFYINRTYSFGRYNASAKNVVMQIVESDIVMDGKETGYLKQATPFAFEGGNNSYNSLSSAEKSYCANMVRGNYTGSLIYAAKNIKDVTDVTDTVAISWSIANDSTLTIHKFPSRLLAEQISDEALKSAIADYPDQDINCSIGFVTISPIQWLINPVAPSYKVQFEGGEHEIHVAFYANSSTSFGRYTSSSNKVEMQIIEGAIFMDKKETGYLTQAIPFAFEAEKK